jgi:hypothetical protein
MRITPDEVIGFFSIDLILLAALGPGVYSASNRKTESLKSHAHTCSKRERDVRFCSSSWNLNINSKPWYIPPKHSISGRIRYLIKWKDLVI